MPRSRPLNSTALGLLQLPPPLPPAMPVTLPGGVRPPPPPPPPNSPSQLVDCCQPSAPPKPDRADTGGVRNGVDSSVCGSPEPYNTDAAPPACAAAAAGRLDKLSADAAREKRWPPAVLVPVLSQLPPCVLSPPCTCSAAAAASAPSTPATAAWPQTVSAPPLISCCCCCVAPAQPANDVP